MGRIVINKTGIISVKLTIKGIVGGLCEYRVMRNQELKDPIFIKRNKTEFIGNPDDIKDDVVGWDVRVFNPGMTEQKYAVILEWIQNGKIIYSWIPEGGPFTIIGNLHNYQVDGYYMVIAESNKHII